MGADTSGHSARGTEGAHAKGGSRSLAAQGPHCVRHGKSRMGGPHASLDLGLFVYLFARVRWL